jgi:hypothetical protein
MMISKNHRPNLESITLPGACFGHPGQIIADLHDPHTGEFVRAAVVADVGASGGKNWSTLQAEWDPE